jgi:histidine ammonia-lyase
MGAILSEFLENVRNGTVPTLLLNASPKVSSQYAELTQAMLYNQDESIYGVTSGPGHRDIINVTPGDRDSWERGLIASHSLAVRDPYDCFSSRCIGYAKAYSIAYGGPLISGELYNLLLRAITNPQFNPKIPKFSSYSCGDVIPGSHWAADFLQFAGEDYKLKPGEGMALINGAFVHVGRAASMVPRVESAWTAFVEATKNNAVLTRANLKNFNVDFPAEKAKTIDAVKYVSEYQKCRENVPQDPVSIRSIPQVLDSLITAAGWFGDEINQSLFKASENPQLRTDVINPNLALAVHPQGSFMLPTLAISTSAVVDAILLAMWASVARTNYLLSGRIDGIPQDGSSAVEDVGYIQWPKIMTALLEEARHKAAGRVYVTGGSTSYGVEDLWSHGIVSLEILSDILELSELLSCYEIVLQGDLGRKFSERTTNTPRKLHVHNDMSIKEKLSLVGDYIESKQGYPRKLLFGSG